MKMSYTQERIMRFVDNLLKNVSSSESRLSVLTNCHMDSLAPSDAYPSKTRASSMVGRLHQLGEKQMKEDIVDGFILTGLRSTAPSGMPSFHFKLTAIDRQGRRLQLVSSGSSADTSSLMNVIDELRQKIRIAHDSNNLGFSL